MKTSHLATTIVLSLAGAIVPTSALARKVVTSPYNHTTNVYIGSNDQGQFVQFYSPKLSECTVIKIGGTGGLTDDVVVVLGNGRDNAIIPNDATYQGHGRCGMGVTSPKYNGHYLDVYGQDGDDSLISVSDGDTWFRGGKGNDSITASLFSVESRAYGDDGEDLLFGNILGDSQLSGDADDDILCAPDRAFLLQGGTGYDCRRGSAAHIQSVESTSCKLECGF